MIKMTENYIQLPPLPCDTPTEIIEIVWTYSRMEKSDKEKVLTFMRENMASDIELSEKQKMIKLIEESKPSPYVEEFHSLMQKLIGTLIAQSCEMSALVYQKYCIEKNSIKEISETFHVPENSVELMAQYYDTKLK
ncbi:hypothetical protein [Sporofaciens musculi]|uniref:hypothetical protein n=1 Tax=Sporofaciens musculi TaxID=2681861 RepID=UPI0025A281ED|nr:hypothetical protein [Sporofaciens musculi]